MKNSLDIRVNQRVLKLKDKTYLLDFDMQALSLAENVYKTQFGSDINVSEIVLELFKVKMTALMAFTYGAIRSAGTKMTWDEFSKTVFTYDNFNDVFAVVSEAITELFSMGDDDDDKETPPAEDDEKN
ncbi:MAG: hypothetical protein GX418_12175 [Clostridiales bacterium]|nr:hypothetical protein [Clostridiales bacterium]